MCSWLQLDPSVGRCVWPEANLISCGYPQNCGGNNCFRCARKRIKKSHLLIRRWDPTNSTFGSRGGLQCAVLWGEYPKPEGLRKTIIKESMWREWGYIKVGFFYFLGIIFADDFSLVGIPMTNLQPRTPQVKPAAPAPVSPVLQPLNAQLLQQLLAAQAQAQAHELWVLTFWGKKHLQKLWGCFLLALEVW